MQNSGYKKNLFYKAATNKGLAAFLVLKENIQNIIA